MIDTVQRQGHHLPVLGIGSALHSDARLRLCGIQNPVRTHAQIGDRDNRCDGVNMYLRAQLGERISVPVHRIQSDPDPSLWQGLRPRGQGPTAIGGNGDGFLQGCAVGIGEGDPHPFCSLGQRLGDLFRGNPAIRGHL